MYITKALWDLYNIHGFHLVVGATAHLPDLLGSFFCFSFLDIVIQGPRSWDFEPLKGPFFLIGCNHLLH